MFIHLVQISTKTCGLSLNITLIVRLFQSCTCTVSTPLHPHYTPTTSPLHPHYTPTTPPLHPHNTPGTGRYRVY